MRLLRFAATLVLPVALWGSSEVFERGMKALAAKDYAAALGFLETALAAEPDNLQYGSEYRQAIVMQSKQIHPKEGQTQDYERSLKFFEALVAAHPQSANAWLNYGFAYVDKIPAAGAISQVILANTALSHFTKSIETKPSWLGYYTRGNSYLFWPKIFGRAPLGVADLEQALKIQKTGGKKTYHLRVYISLGDAYWKTDQLEKAQAIWKEGLTQFPGATALKDRLAKEGDALKQYLDDVVDPSRRVDTDLREIWKNP